MPLEATTYMHLLIPYHQYYLHATCQTSEVGAILEPLSERNLKVLSDNRFSKDMQLLLGLFFVEC